MVFIDGTRLKIRRFLLRFSKLKKSRSPSFTVFLQGTEPLIALCFEDSWIHATVAVFLIIACGYNLAKEVFQMFDEVGTSTRNYILCLFAHNRAVI